VEKGGEGVQEERIGEGVLLVHPAEPGSFTEQQGQEQLERRDLDPGLLVVQQLAELGHVALELVRQPGQHLGLLVIHSPHFPNLLEPPLLDIRGEDAAQRVDGRVNYPLRRILQTQKETKY